MHESSPTVTYYGSFGWQASPQSSPLKCPDNTNYLLLPFEVVKLSIVYNSEPIVPINNQSSKISIILILGQTESLVVNLNIVLNNFNLLPSKLYSLIQPSLPPE